MIRLQTVEVTIGGDVLFMIHLNEIPPGFEAELFLPLDEGATFRTMLREPKGDARSAFEWAVGKILAYCNARGLAPSGEVDNPCNTEFLPAADQRASLQALGADWPVRVNGV